MQLVRLSARRDRVRLLVGLALAVGLPLMLPAAVSPRLWFASALAPVFTWLVLGRDRGLAADGVRRALQGAPAGYRWALASWVLPLAVVAVWAAGAARGLAPGAVLFAWTAALLLTADALDRRYGRAGTAWVVVWAAALGVLTMPVWMAPWFGDSHWPATLSVALHPVGAALAAAGRSTLQDPWFYRWSLSGVIEARPAPWFWGLTVFGGAALLAAWAGLRAVYRPHRA